MLTRQQIFDMALNGVRAQGVPSVTKQPSDDPHSSNCRYRVFDGDKPVLKCGIGHVIPDNAYDPAFDSHTDWQGRLNTGVNYYVGISRDALKDPVAIKFKAALTRAGVDLGDRGIVGFLSELQSAHDRASPRPDFLGVFERNMQGVALYHDLTYTPPAPTLSDAAGAVTEADDTRSDLYAS
jgi:hypothetical protein